MNSRQKATYDLTEGPVARQLILFAYPFMLSNLLQLVYNLVDLVIVGHFGGSVSQSAVSVGGDLLTFLTNLCIGFSNGGQVMIAQAVGNKNKKAVQETAGNMFTVVLIGALLFSAITLPGNRFLLDWMNTPAEALSEAQSYTMVCFGGLFFVYGYNVVSSILRGMGDSKRPLMFIGLAAFTNLLLDLLFVAVFHWAAFGAALATVIAQAFSFLASLIYLWKHREGYDLDLRSANFLPRVSTLIPMFQLGLPMALQMSAISVSMLFVKSYVNSYGVIASAVTGIGDKLRNVMSVITRSMGNAGSSMVGQNMGARKYDRINELIRTSMLICLAAACVFSGIAILFPRAVFSLFNTEEAVLEMAELYMPSLAMCFFSFALISPFNALMNGTGAAMLGLASSLLDGIVARVGLSVLLGNVLGWGIQGFWYGSALAGFVATSIGGSYYFSGLWRKRGLVLKK
ncbi:MAG: MATE family efflux transporter [Clostridiales bacterium]|nr:MATE family efflux transporter [Clostridiales bacterium]